MYIDCRYENKGVAWMKSISDLPPGLAPEPETQPKTTLSKNAKKNQKKKEKRQQEGKKSTSGGGSGVSALEAAMRNARMDEPSFTPPSAPKTNVKSAPISTGGLTVEEIQKKIRNINKKLKEIDNLQAKIDSGEIAKPEQNQIEKIAKREQFEKDLSHFERLLEQAS